MLIRQLFDEGKDCGKRVSIHVEQNNPARNLYDRLGFEEAGSFGMHTLMEWKP